MVDGAPQGHALFIANGTDGNSIASAVHTPPTFAISSYFPSYRDLSPSKVRTRFHRVRWQFIAASYLIPRLPNHPTLTITYHLHFHTHLTNDSYLT